MELINVKMQYKAKKRRRCYKINVMVDKEVS
jgi:hypothetical protein